MTNLWQDLRFGARMLLKKPGFTLIAVITLSFGRFFTQEENRVEGRDAVIVLSHYFWQQRFGADFNVVGRTLLLNGKPFTVIGVTDPDFVGLQIEMPEIWLPLMMRADKSTVQFAGPQSENRDWFGDRELQWLSLYARLKPGKTVAEAQAGWCC